MYIAQKESYCSQKGEIKRRNANKTFKMFARNVASKAAREAGECFVYRYVGDTMSEFLLYQFTSRPNFST